MKTDTKNRGYNEIIRRIIILFITIFFIIVFLSVTIGGTITSEHNLIILNTSIGLLTFVAIFYSFVLKTELKQRRNELLIKKWRDNYDEFSEYLGEIHEEKDKTDPDYSVLLYASHKLNALLEEISQLAVELNINKFLNYCVFLFIVAIICVVVDYVGGFETVSLGGFPFTYVWVGFVAMWFGMYMLLRLIMAWIIISEYKP